MSHEAAKEAGEVGATGKTRVTYLVDTWLPWEFLGCLSAEFSLVGDDENELDNVFFFFFSENNEFCERSSRMVGGSLNENKGVFVISKRKVLSGLGLKLFKICWLKSVQLLTSCACGLVVIGYNKLFMPFSCKSNIINFFFNYSFSFTNYSFGFYFVVQKYL